MVSEERFEELIERVKDLEEENKQLKKRLKNRSEDTDSEKLDNKLSRRSFLKKLGAGAVGLGALGLSPAASQLKLSKNGLFTDTGLGLTDSGSEYFKVNSGGPVEVKNTDLRLPVGNLIEDDAGTPRLIFHSYDTQIRTEDGTRAFSAYENYGGGIIERNSAGSSPRLIRDNNGDFDALRYYSSSSAPGRFELTNATLDMSGGNIQMAAGQRYEFNGADTTGGTQNCVAWPNQGGGQRCFVTSNSNGEIVAEDDSGNRTTLS